MTDLHAIRRPVVFDLDGTLFNTPLDGGGEIFSNPAALARASTAFMGARAALARVQGQGRQVAFLTGRSEALRSVTIQQLRALGVRWPRVAMQTTWEGWDAYTRHKVGWLKTWQAVCYVGDLPEDKHAAAMAGVRFLWPEEVGIQREVLA